MDLTKHAYERIQGRTQMLTKDVLSLIKEDAVVSLGSYERFEYLLFYSPPDKSAKIAVVAENRTVLVSIWDQDYLLPDSLGKVDHRLVKRAKKALNKYIIDKVPLLPVDETSQQPLEEDTYRRIVKIAVSDNGKTIYIHECGETSTKYHFEFPDLMPFLQSHLHSMVDIVEQNLWLVDGSIYYSVLIFNPGASKPFREVLLSHKKLKKRLNKQKLAARE